MATSNELNLEVKPDTFALGLLLGECRKKKEFIDVQFQIGDKLFDAHRNILSLHSPVLKAMISDQWSTTKTCQLSNEFVDEEIMEDLLNFLYTGKIQLTPDNAYPVCVAAHFFQISILLEPTVKYLCKQIVADNVLPLYLFSKCRDIKLLKNCCLRFLSTDFDKVFQDLQILDFSFQDFKDLIVGLKVRRCESEIWENIFDCIVRWTEKDLSKRSDNLPILFENIPLDELSFEFLTQTVSTHPLIKESLSCTQPLLKAFSNFRAVSKTKQNLIVLGGKSQTNIRQTSMICYDPRSRVWENLPNMKRFRCYFAATATNETIIVCGGYNTDETIDSVEMFEWSSQTWTELPSLPLRLGSPSMAIYNGKLYVAGGDIDSGSPLSTVLCYSFETSEWRYVKSMNDARADCHLIAYKNYLYAIGGHTCTVERYDSVLDEWTMMASMESAQQWFGATLHKDRIYVCGAAGFEFYDPEKNVWNSHGAPAHLWCGEGTSLVSMNDKLLAVGGSRNDDKSDSVYEYNFQFGRWDEFGKLPTELLHHCSLSGAFF